MPVFWHPGGRPPLRNIYRDLIKLRKQYAALYSGDVAWLQNTAAEEVVSFLRKDEKDEFLVLINLTSHRAAGSVDLSNAEGFEPVKISGRAAPLDPLPSGFSLNGYEWSIYHRTIPK
jgi:glycosidase